MIPLDEAQRKEFRKARMVGIAMFIVAPPVYLAIAFFGVQRVEPIAAESDLVFYILLIIASLQPLLLPLIERVQISNFKQQSNNTMTAAQMYATTTITKLASVSAIFVYGLVMFMLSGSTLRMLAFYAIGICWSFVHWPRQEKMQKFLERSQPA